MAVLLNSAPESLAEEVLPHKRWTRSELLLIEETGVFDDTHFELIEGELIDKKGQKYPHVKGTRATVIALQALFGVEEVIQGTSIDVALGDMHRNEPEPDVTVLRISLHALNGNPQPSDIVLVVEIADTSLRQDLTTKAGLYARAGITEYWVVNLKHGRLHVFREPSEGSYTVRFELGETDTVAPLAQAKASIPVTTLLG